MRRSTGESFLGFTNLLRRPVLRLPDHAKPFVLHTDQVHTYSYWSYTITCAAVIAGTWAAHLYVWRKESINMFLILYEESSKQQKFYQIENVKIRSLATYQQCVSAIGLRLMQNP